MNRGDYFLRLRTTPMTMQAAAAAKMMGNIALLVSPVCGICLLALADESELVGLLESAGSAVKRGRRRCS